ncbi:hypothetical protein ACLB2K_071914 [Fragaria x ananassa]
MAGYNNITAAFAVIVIAVLVFRPASMVVLADNIVAGVGEDTGWNSEHYDYQGWADGYSFQTGDTLFFHYDPDLYDVVVAGSGELFDACSTDQNLGTYDSGRDELVLPTPGIYYFFASFACASHHMKFYVVVH